MKPLILITTDDVDYYLLLDHVLEGEGFHTLLAGDLEETLRVAIEREPRVVVLDCRPQSFPSAMTCAQLKQNADTNSIHVVAVVSPGAERDHVDLINAGADDTFTKPVLPGKLIACIQDSLNHRSGKPVGRPTVGNEKLLTYGGIEMSLRSYRVRRNGRDIQLAPTEFRLLRHFLKNPGQVLSRDELIGAAWLDNESVDPRTVDVHVGRLRRTLMSSSDKNMIRTVRSAGYALTDEEEKDEESADS